MKKSWWRQKIGSAFSFECKCLLTPLLFVVSVVAAVSYFAASYVMAAEKRYCGKGVCAISNQILQSPIPEKIKIITVEELKKEIEDNDELVVINVLDKKSYQKAHIPGSVNIPFKDVKKFKKKVVKKYSKETPIVVHCASPECSLSEQAYKSLTQLGYTNVREFKGGIQAWKDSGAETEEG